MKRVFPVEASGREVETSVGARVSGIQFEEAWGKVLFARGTVSYLPDGSTREDSQGPIRPIACCTGDGRGYDFGIKGCGGCGLWGACVVVTAVAAWTFTTTGGRRLVPGFGR